MSKSKKKQVIKSNKKSLKNIIEEHPFTAILTLIGLLVGTLEAINGFWNEFKDTLVIIYRLNLQLC